MNCISLQALVEASLQDKCSDTDVSGPLNWSPTRRPCLWHDKTMEASRLSRFGMTCEPLMDGRGQALLTSWLAGFRAKPIARQLQAKTMQMISGRKCGGSWQMSLPGTSLPRTYRSEQLTQRQTTCKRWATKSGAFPLPRLTWVQITFGADIGYLHTPTCTANYAAPSMQKWKAARAFKAVFGRPTPVNHEWMMGWPLGWTDLKPLEMGKSRNAPQQPSECSSSHSTECAA